MPSLKDIKRRITSVESTQKITSAMKMVAAAKLRRAQETIENARPYAERMRSTLEQVAGSMATVEHPLFEVRDDVRSIELIIITSDRGLAGAFNNAVIKLAEQLLAEREGSLDKVSLTLLGKKVADFYKRHRPGDVREAAPVGNNPTYAEAAGVARAAAKRFEEGEVDEVILVYSEFVTTMTQTPRVVQLLPVSPPKTAEDAAPASEEDAAPYDIEPSPESLLSVLVPKAVETEVFRALLENAAGEHAARMTAMESATKNTEELIDKLTLQFNRARQAAITSELVEIVTGAQALD
ncbi:MAG: ATP synthase F1 subunit gamma [Myxococcota bacterium]|nr:ATP synthase F1 subunit gamma [Myxococcota bacterium]